MGQVSSIGLGISLFYDGNVFVIDGDCSLMMNYGTLITCGFYGRENFKHIVLDNEAYDSCSGEESLSRNAHFEMCASLNGYASAIRAESADEILLALKMPNQRGLDINMPGVRMRSVLDLDFGESDFERRFYVALPIRHDSAFMVCNEKLYLNGIKLGRMERPLTDDCNSHYWRRGRTALVMNPNLRTNCRGCTFCIDVEDGLDWFGSKCLE